jgi:hypothetical protein
MKGKRNMEVVKFLIEEKNADHAVLIDGGKFSVLHMAIAAPYNVSLVEYIVKKFPGLVVEKTGATGTPLDYAHCLKEVEIACIIQQKLDKED